jgi:hypothetical protein
MQSSLLALALANKFFPDPLVGVPPAVSVCELFLLLSHNLPNFNKKGSSVHVAPACAGSGVLNSRSLPHRLGRGSRILSRHEREREKGCGTHLRGSRDPAWVLAAAWSPWRLSVLRRRGRRLGRDPGDLRVANGTDRGRRRSRAMMWRRW